jgi:hypothetical protein
LAGHEGKITAVDGGRKNERRAKGRDVSFWPLRRGGSNLEMAGGVWTKHDVLIIFYRSKI